MYAARACARVRVRVSLRVGFYVVNLRALFSRLPRGVPKFVARTETVSSAFEGGGRRATGYRAVHFNVRSLRATNMQKPPHERTNSNSGIAPVLARTRP